MEDYLWTRVAPAPADEQPIFHMFEWMSTDMHTLCGLEISREAWDMALEKLGNHRPCDNCTEIAARRADT